MAVSLRVLILEDRPADAELMVEELRKAGFEPDWRRVDTERAYADALAPSLDLVLSDHSLPQYDSVRALERFTMTGLDIPFIIVSGKIGEELAVDQLKRGAADYVLKDRMARLGPAVVRALEEKRLRDQKRKAEQKLLDNEAWFRALLEKSHDGIDVINSEGAIVYASPSIHRILGCHPETHVGTKLADWLHPEEVDGVQRTFGDLVAHPGMTHTGTYRGRHRDGSWRWIEVVATSHINQGPVNGILANFRDVTDARQAAEEIQKREKLLSESQRIAHIGSWRWEYPSGHNTWTDEVYRIFGTTPATFNGDPEAFQALIHPEDRPVMTRWLDQAFARKKPEAIEFRIVRPDGTVRLVRGDGEIEVDEAGNILCAFGTAQDITVRKQAEDALVLFRTLLDRTNDAIEIVDPGTGRFLDVNEKACVTHGYSRDEYLSLTVPDVEESLTSWPPPDEALAELQAQGTLTVEGRHRRKDGSTFPVETALNFIRLERDYIVAVVRDITERKQAQQRLLLQGAALEAAANAITITDHTGAIAWVNRAFSQMTGYTPTEVIGQNPRLLKSGQQTPAYYQDLWNTILAGKVWRGELVNRRKDGSLYTDETTITPVNADGKGITHFIAIKQDVTQRKHTEEALRASEAKMSAVSNAALDAIIMIDSEGLAMFWNPAAEAILGYSAHDILGRRLHDVLTPPRFRPDAERGLAAFKQTGEGSVIGKVLELSALHRDGHEFPIELSINKVRLGDQWCAVGILRDITERKRTENALSERARLAALTADVGISLTQQASLRGILQRCTEALVHHLGAAFARIWTVNGAGDTLELQASAGLYTHLDGAHARVPVGMYKIGLIAQERKPHLTNQVIGDPRVHHQDWARREGMVAFAGHPLVIGDKLCGVMAVFARQPLSEETLKALAAVANEVALGIERKWGEESLRTLNAELEQRVRDRTAQLDAANKELEAFAYSVSHDLRAPLRGIDGFSQALLEDYGDKLGADGKCHLQRVRSASQRMARQIDDILQLSRLTRSAMTRQPVDLSALAERVIYDLRAGERDRHVAVNIAPGLTAVGDPTLLEVVLLNLLGNAWKFTGKTERARIEFGAMEHQGQPTFFIRDNGAGFDMAYAERLFGAFQRFHTEAEFPGTGIGLATVQRIIRRHGGQIWAEGAVGKGATFFFTLSGPAMAEGGDHA